LKYIITIYIIAPFSPNKIGGIINLDPLLRGLCEQHIDEKMLEIDIQEILDVVQVLDLPVSSKEDASIGLFLGMIYDVLVTQCMKVYSRHPSSEEISDYYTVMGRRAYEFKSVLNKNHLLPDHEKENIECESILEVDEEQLRDIEIDWGARSRKRSNHTIFGIPIPVR